jgi:hypothetical protein
MADNGTESFKDGNHREDLDYGIQGGNRTIHESLEVRLHSIPRSVIRRGL